MANYQNGKDNGTLGAHPSFLDAFIDLVGPYRDTYNGLKRTSFGYFSNDETADSLLTHITNYNNNLDKLLTVENTSVVSLGNRIPVRNNDGDLFARRFVGADLVLTGSITLPRIDGGTLEEMEAA